ncbi:hypothetical protein BSKO_13049 [Bryopsis sp. KO-2023]|nr:hypothetical protein BSKO_13049 [Bryopsis sp. KO-2023]
MFRQRTSTLLDRVLRFRFSDGVVPISFNGFQWKNGCWPNEAETNLRKNQKPLSTASNGTSGRASVSLTPKVESRLHGLKERYTALCDQLSGSGTLSSDSIQDVNRELGELEPLIVMATDLEQKKKEINSLQDLLDDASQDPDLAALAKQEHEELSAELPKLEEKLVLQLLPKDEDDSRAAIIEVRPGVGGDEGALFALDLYNMYKKYAAANRWKMELLSLDMEELGGCKLATVAVLAEGAYGKLKYESGVHRVQRVPKTEMMNRIHTSTASVVVFPKVEEVDVSLNQDDLNIEYMRATGAGGQHVNTTESAVRMTHKPTGITVMMQDERSQHSNKKRALEVLMARLYELQQTQNRESKSKVRKTAIGSGDRSARIRTYNFPQGRITDHRIGLTEYGMEDMMNGLKIDKFIEALQMEDQLEKLEEFSDS